MRRTVVGSLISALLSVGLAAAMIPLRAHLSIATASLVLIIPVVSGVTIGGFVAGLVGVIAGFLTFDVAFIPPYGTLSVGAGQNWVALAVYVVVMVLVARVVASLEQASTASQSRAVTARRLFELSELLLTDRPVWELASTIVGAVRDAFGIAGVALLLAVNDRLEVVARAGEGIDDDDLARLRPAARRPVALSTERSGPGVHTLALATAGHPVGLLVVAGVPPVPAMREALPALANHLAVALERAQLHERVRQAELLEEVDRLRHALVGAVSHDLRTPLAAIKVASSTLADPAVALSEADAAELHRLIDSQTDRLTTIVDNVLDMTRIQAGVLEPRCEPCLPLELVTGAVEASRAGRDARELRICVPPDLPAVDADRHLIDQVLANLIDNADRHGPPGTPVTVAAAVDDQDRVAFSVTDRGAGVPPGLRQTIFDTFSRFDSGGRAGLGLAIAKAFVEAHGERIWVEEAPGGGARFVFTLPVAGADGSLASRS